MGWRVLLLSQSEKIAIEHRQLKVWLSKPIVAPDYQTKPETVQIPLEDLGVVVFDHLHTQLNTYVLSQFAEYQISVLVVDALHLPSAALFPFMPHTRTLSRLQKQIELSLPAKKQAWQKIIQQKITNQAQTLYQQYVNHGLEEIANIHQTFLDTLAQKVKSGDTGHIESQASQYYFKHLLGQGFTRQDNNFYNSAFNYAYAITRALLAKYAAAYGLVPCLGIFHHNVLNAFNLADDLIEPYRALIEAYVLSLYPCPPNEHKAYQNKPSELQSKDKQNLIKLCQQSLTSAQGVSDWVRMTENTVQSFVQYLHDKDAILQLPRGFFYEQNKE